MKADTSLDEGMIANTLGYYEVNDGGNGTYVIKNDNTLVDDGGSVHTLNNGLSAVLIINKTISYRQFGAKLDGNDDSNSIVSCHTFANDNDVDIEEHGGDLLCNFNVYVKTNCNLDINFIVDDNTVSPVYKLQHEETFNNKTIDVTTSTYNTNDTDLYNKFGILTNTSQWVIGKRPSSTGDDTTYYHNQPIAFDNIGTMITGNIMYTGTGCTITDISDIREKGLTFKGGTILVSNEKIGNKILIEVSRNNSIIKNFNIKAENPTSSSKEVGRGLLRCFKACNILFENITGNNHSIDTSANASYILENHACFNVKYKNITVFGGWGATQSAFCDTFSFENCQVNRIDNHYGIFGNVNISSCSLNGVSYINLGYGNADVNIENTSFYKEGSKNMGITFREDFFLRYGGKLCINNCSITDRVGAQTYLLKIPNYVANTGTSTLTNSAPTIMVSNCIMPTSNSNRVVYLGTIDTESFASAGVPLYFVNCEGALLNDNAKTNAIYNGCTMTSYTNASGFRSKVLGGSIASVSSNCDGISFITGGEFRSSIKGKSTASFYVNGSLCRNTTIIASTFAGTVNLVGCSCGSPVTASSSGTVHVVGCYNIS